MNLEQAKACFLNSYLVNAEVLKNPSNMAQWFVLVQNSFGKSYMLEDDNGFRQVMVHLTGQ